MKCVILLLFAVSALAVLAGCVFDREAQAPTRCTNNNSVDFPEGGAEAGGGAGGGCGLRGRRGEEIGDGPATGAVTYPYYTVRGPRDFLQKSPTPIGP